MTCIPAPALFQNTLTPMTGTLPNQDFKRLTMPTLMATLMYLSSASVFGQWSSQQIILSGGWNAIYLEVDPVNRNCDALFAGYPQVESVWKYDRTFTTVQFQQNPSTPLPDSAHWIGWLPKSNPEAFLGKLTQLQGGNAYMIRVPDRAQSFVWSLKGMPSPPLDHWVPNTLNLAGFPVDKMVAPTVATFFQGISEINVGPGTSSTIYSLNADGNESQIRQPEHTFLKAGTAYWLRVERFLHSSLPFAIEGEYKASRKLDFGTDRTESLLTLRNLSGVPLNLKFALLPSESAPNGQPELAGPVPMARFVSDPIKKILGWQEFTSPFDVSLAVSESQDLRLGVQRNLLRAYRPSGTNGAMYQALIEIRELSHGVRLVVPVAVASSAIGVANRARPKSLTASSADSSSLSLYALSQGLWIGQAQITQVNRPSYSTDATLGKSGQQLLQASSPLTTRLIVHVDTNGTSRLLQRALLVWQPPATSASTNGQYLLYTDESAVPASTQDVFRVSSVTLPPMQPQVMTGVFSESLSGTVALGYNDPVNPFKHAYHPDHDNLDELFSTNKLSAGVESFNVTRQISLNFHITHQLSDGSYVPPAAVVKLDGQKSYISVDPVAFGTSATIEAWVKVDSTSTNAQYVFYLDNDSSNSLFLSIGGPNKTMTLGCTSPVTPFSSGITTTNPFPAAQWVYVAAALDGAALKNGGVEGRIYWNGQEVAEGPLNFPSGITRTNVYFGRGRASDSGFLQGSIYDLTLWGDTRDSAEIQGDMQLGYTPNPDFLIASFAADEGAGTILSDAHGGALKATLQQAQWDDNAGYRAAFWDIGEREGIYSEIITGLRPQPILLQGAFSLQRLNKDGSLH
jgi:hypothetical protein